MHSAFEFRTGVEEVQRQRARLIEIEKYLNTVTRRASRELVQILQPLFVAGAAFWLPGTGRELVQHGLEPHAIHPGGGEPCEIAVGIGVGLRVEQRIAIEGEVGVAEAKLVRGGRTLLRGRNSGRQLAHELEQRFLFDRQFFVELGFDEACDLGFALTRGVVGGSELQWRASRLQAAELDVEEVILAQGERQFFRRPVEQGQQLRVGQQMPVALDDGDVAAALLVACNARRLAQSHAAGERKDVPALRTDDGRETLDRHELPVAPDERVQAAGEMRE